MILQINNYTYINILFNIVSMEDIKKIDSPLYIDNKIEDFHRAQEKVKIKNVSEEKRIHNIDKIKSNNEVFNQLIKDLIKCKRGCSEKYKARNLALKYNTSEKNIFKWKRMFL